MARALVLVMRRSPGDAVPLAVAVPCGTAGRGGVVDAWLGSLTRAARVLSSERACGPEAAGAAASLAQVVMDGLITIAARSPGPLLAVIGRGRGGAGKLLIAIQMPDSYIPAASHR